MRLKRVTLRNFRGVADSTVEFDTGVTIVAGPNEVGKSSIAEALRVVRAYKHNSKAGPVRALQPVGRDVGPEVEIELATQGYDVRMRKRWLRDPIAELHVTGVSNEQLQSDEAHERFLTLLAETVDLDLLEALEVVQGQSLQYARLAGLRSLTQALDSTSETVGEHDELLDQIEEEYREFFTPTGRPRGRYVDLADEVSQLEDELQEADAKSQEMDELTAEVQRQSKQLEQDKEDLDQAVVNLKEQEEKDAALTGLRQQVEQAASAVKIAEETLQVASDGLEARTLLIDELKQRQNTVSEHSHQVEELGQEHDQARKKVEQLRRDRDAANEAVGAARAHAQSINKQVEVTRQGQELKSLTTRLERARKANEQITEAKAALARLGVDEGLWQRISEAATQVQIARSARDTAAGQVRVVPVRGGQVFVNDTPVDEEIEVSITDEVIVRVPEVVEVDIQPGVFPQDLRHEVEHAEQLLQELLEEGSVASPEEAREVLTKRNEVDNDLRIAQQTLEGSLGEDTLEDVEHQHARLTSLVGDGEVDDDLQALLHHAEEAQSTVTQTEGELQALTQALGEQQEAFNTVREALIRAQADLENHQVELTRLQTKLDNARQAASDEELRQRVDQAHTSVADCRQQLQKAEAELDKHNPDAIAMQLVNAQDWHTSAYERVEATGERLQAATTLLDDRAKDGLYDKGVELRAQLTARQEEYARLQRRAEAVSLLREVMHRHRKEAHARYVQPFTEAIQRIGKVVFGSDFGVDVTIDLEISHRHLQGETIAFGDLSAGAQEQLGLIGRLAAATLIDTEDGAPLILDDTLGFADNERLARFGAVLNDVGKHAQIIVLTCQPQRFSRVGGAKVVHLSPAGGL